MIQIHEKTESGSGRDERSCYTRGDTKTARGALTVGYDEIIPDHGLRGIDIVVASDSGAHTKSPILVTKHSKVSYASAETFTKDSMNNVGIAARPWAAVICTIRVDLDVKSV